MKKKSSLQKVPSLKCAPHAGRKKKADFVLGALQKRYPAPATHLTAANPFELLVATVLSAQCTDERVNKVTPALFQRFPSPADLGNAEQEEVEALVRSTGFFRNKAKNIIAASRRIHEVYGGRVPNSMAELLTLAGVARKTANVVLWGAYGINEGIAVDTHVNRISFRLGLSSGDDPVKTEKELTALFPQKEWGNVNHRLVWFGRDVCAALKPLCGVCELEEICEKNGLAEKKGGGQPR